MDGAKPLQITTVKNHDQGTERLRLELEDCALAKDIIKSLTMSLIKL